MSIYKKPNIKYTTMAIYIDQHIYTKDCDYDLCFQYIYHLFNMLAYKNKLFQTSKDYENFAIYGASKLIMRYKNPKQFTGNMKKIKSVLNWIKKSIYGLSVNFKQEEYQERFNEYSMDQQGLNELSLNLTNKANNLNAELLKIDIDSYFSYLTRIVKQVIKETPYKNRKADFHNIYLSVMLTFISSITPNYYNRKRLNNKLNKGLPSEDLIDSIYHKESKCNAICFHLPLHMNNFILFLVNKLKHIIRKDIIYLIGYYRLSEDVARELLESPMENIVDKSKQE